MVVRFIVVRCTDMVHDRRSEVVRVPRGASRKKSADATAHVVLVGSRRGFATVVRTALIRCILNAVVTNA